MSTFVCMCMYIWHLRVISICYCLLLQEPSVQRTHIYYIYIKWCAATLTRWHPLGLHIACWTGSTSFDMLMRTFYVLCLCLRENVCVCLCMCFTLLLKSRREMLQMCCTFIPESSFEVRGSHGNLTFHCGSPLIKIELSVFSLNPHSIFFFNRDERFCLRCPGSCVPCCLVISEINSSTSPSCA